MLLCCRCKQHKPAEEFSVDKNQARGRRYDCKPCAREALQEYRDNRKKAAQAAAPNIEMIPADAPVFFAVTLATGEITADRRAEVCPWLRGGTR